MDEPMPLDVAVTRCFPHGGITKSTLLAAIRRGALVFEKVGRTYLVTEADIAAWRSQCREEAKGRNWGHVRIPTAMRGSARIRAIAARTLELPAID